jgi:hypothetical protein
MSQNNPDLKITRCFDKNPITTDDKIDILSQLIRFATFKNLSFVQRKDSTSESENELEEPEQDRNDGKKMDDIEFIGKRAYNKDKTIGIKNKSSIKKVKTTSKNLKNTDEQLEKTLKDMSDIYKLFHALDGLSPKDID